MIKSVHKVFSVSGDLLIELVLLPYRITNLLAILIHGCGHGTALWLTSRAHRTLGIAVVLEGLPLRLMLKSLLPGQPLPQYSDHPPRLSNHNGSTWQCRLVSVSGILANLVSTTGCLLWLGKFDVATQAQHHPLLFIYMSGGYFLAANLMAMLSIPDLIGLFRGHVDHWACGPAFAIRYRPDPEPQQADGIVSDRLLGMVEILAREASTRGGQSGGFAIMVQKQGVPSIIFDKVVKGKREDIVRILMERLNVLLGKSIKQGYTPAKDFEAILLHLRYATGGATHWHNAQPHWYEHYDAMTHHRVEDGQLFSVQGEVFNMIAHNGDMDGVYMDVMINNQQHRHFFTQQDVRHFFLTAMPWTSSEGNSDSRSVAEWVDFHLTQGLAYKALRYAYYSSVLDFNGDIACGNIDNGLLLRLADVVDQTMVRIRKTQGLVALNPPAKSLADMSAEAQSVLMSALCTELKRTFDSDTTGVFQAAFAEAFFHHDLTWVMRRASRDMVGEFALMVCTTLEPRMGVFSLTQAFSIGYNLTRGEIFGSAEPLGVTTALQRGEPDDAAYQIYLEDGQYATIDYRPDSDDSPIRIYDRAMAKDDSHALARPSTKTFIAGGAEKAGVAWFPVNHNPRIPRYSAYQSESSDIPKDLGDIPYLLKQVVKSFTPGGDNHPAMNNLRHQLFDNLLDPVRDSNTYDLVLYGVDFNQDLINEFALALHSLMPGLRIRAENSGNILKEMKRAKREGIGHYGPKTLFLGVSNSAQTQSTLAVVRKARDLVGTERCFVLSQNCLNSMSEAIGQRYQADAPVLPNTFVNLSDLSPDGRRGRRRAEAATIVVVATQAVLTEILICLTQEAIESYPLLGREANKARDAHSVLRQDINQTDIQAFREFQSAVYCVDIPNRVGCNTEGHAIDTPDAIQIEQEARNRAENQVEYVRAYALFAAYIIVATVFGVPLFAVMFSPLDFITGVGVIAHILDAALFLTAFWLIHLGIRRLQGRPVFERIGPRAEVFIDRKYIARIIERYNVTLFSNSPAFITPLFYWADTVQDALHRYGIRAHRGVVTIHRTPDERMGIEEANNAAEENMVYAQLGGIRFNGGQPQSRDKVRAGSCYENASRPYQTVLCDSLAGLRAKYDGQLSPEMFRLINRRLIDLADGLIAEFVIGYRRKEIVNQSLWDVIRWLPFAQTIYEIFLRNDIDLRNVAGEADTANQAQIQSTKHPVSPMDIHIQTMAPRPTFDALRPDGGTIDKPFAVLAFSENSIAIHLNPNTLLTRVENPAMQELCLHAGMVQGKRPWVSGHADTYTEGFTGRLDYIDGEECLVIDSSASPLQVSLPTCFLNDAQRDHLIRQLPHPALQDSGAAA